MCGEESVTATTARALGRRTGRPVAWRGEGLSGATVAVGREQLLGRIAPEPADLLLVAFGVNDVTAYRQPKAFADDLAALITAARERVGDAAVVVAGVAPLNCFPALPWPLRNILGWRLGRAAGGSRRFDRAFSASRRRADFSAGPRLVCERRIPSEPARTRHLGRRDRSVGTAAC